MLANCTRNCPRGGAGGCVVPVARGAGRDRLSVKPRPCARGFTDGDRTRRGPQPHEPSAASVARSRWTISDVDSRPSPISRSCPWSTSRLTAPSCVIWPPGTHERRLPRPHRRMHPVLRTPGDLTKGSTSIKKRFDSIGESTEETRRAYAPERHEYRQPRDFEGMMPAASSARRNATQPGGWSR